jgi:dual specificity tyrosine-phosphorylation-regulated kinase 2/3/4
VAVKVIINTDIMHEQGRIECSVLQHLNKIDSSNSHYVVRMFETYVFRRHICATFEILGQNLYEYSRTMRFRPMPARQVRPTARELLEAIAFCHQNSIVHCDVKPENILVDVAGFPHIKLIDFGSSCYIGQQRYDYIQSRFYRAPEVILGLRYGPPMDVWSFACVVLEMIMGKPIFPGATEHEQLDMLMEVFGPIPAVLRNACSRRKEFFTPEGEFIVPQGQKHRQPGGFTLEQITRITDPLLIDLLRKCFAWVQEERISAAEALLHPWFTVKGLVTNRPPTSHILPELNREKK